MPGFGSTAVALLLSYWVGVLTCRWLVLHAFALDRHTIVIMVVVPLVQAAALAAWRRLTRGRVSP